MESLNSFSKLPESPNNYIHKCPHCGKVFRARKNRKYCCDECKVAFNNNNSAIKRARIANDVKTYSNNEVFLYNHSKDNEMVEVSYKYALTCGFNPNGILKHVKDKNTGFEWYMIGDFVYRIEKEQNLMFIQRLNLNTDGNNRI